MGGVSSEAAQKAYPDLVRGDDERYDDFEVRETIMAYGRAAFDAGAVEALRQAAAEFREAESMSNNAPILLSTAAATLEGIAGSWQAGQ